MRTPGASPPPPAPAPLPNGSRDVLAVEAEELTAIELALARVFRGFGYREVRTPVLELADVIDRAQEGGLGQVFRLFDDQGRVLVMRPDLTIPATRLVATRMADHPGPVRASYLSRAFRPPPEGRAQPAEQLQAGVELVGADGPPADAEALAVLADGLRAAGLQRFRIGVGDVSLTAAVLTGVGVGADDRAALEAALAARNLVGWRRRARAVVPDGPEGELAVALPTLRGGPELLGRIARLVPSAEAACARLTSILALVDDHGLGGALMLDLGVMRPLPYYSGIVFEAYADGVSAPVAMGGRYDGLAARFGRGRPAVGFAIALDLLHRALANAGVEAEPVAGHGVVLVGGLDDELDTARDGRAFGPVIAYAGERAGAEALAAAEGWRYVAARGPAGLEVFDRLTDARFSCASLREVLAPPSPPSPR